MLLVKCEYSYLIQPPISSNTSDDEPKECLLCFPFDSVGYNYFTESVIVVRNL